MNALCTTTPGLIICGHLGCVVWHTALSGNESLEGAPRFPPSPAETRPRRCQRAVRQQQQQH
eukprot:CAMPEP_0183558008 /NCGR_PEP_ID=MMETSP0371-20130417/87308_1 /TAXON_ID=268820 /ORGANISM="Peridinium aciculiferum, Strain PAER-2" /LENGTH=61 /DNA_ID=CAMNT_0025765235 /DNA_START=1 /DNA_END=183 /DNA_ORIENTATION=+